MSYEQLGAEIGKLTDEKNKAYGGIHRVAEAMKVFFPEGIPVEKLEDSLLVVRVLDKINRISGGEKAAFEENPWKDIAGYALLGASVKVNFCIGCKHYDEPTLESCYLCKEGDCWQSRKEGTE